MKRKLLTALMLLGWCYAHAQLSGVKTIDNSMATSGSNYASFTEAIDDLNSQGVGPGGVTFNVAAGQTFPEPPLTLWATGTEADPILFTTSGPGSHPRIMPLQPGTQVLNSFGAKGDYFFRIAGSDHVTISGIDLQTDPSYQNDTNRIEYGYYITRMSASQASKHVVISNCMIDLNSNPVNPLRNAAAVFIANHDTTAATLTIIAEQGRHEHIRIHHNTIQNSYHGVVVRGFNHSTAPYNLFDHFITVDSNTLSTYGGASDCYGIYFENNDSNGITGNNISTYTQGSGSLYGIHNGFSLATSSWIIGNTINLTSPSSNAMVYGILNASGSLGSGNVIEIGRNQLQATANNQYTGIQNDGGASVVNIYGNRISSVINMGPSGSATYTIWSGPMGNTTITNIYDNEINNVYSVASSNPSTLFGMILLNGGQETNVYRNRIYDLMHLGGGQVMGLRNNAPNSTIENNYIYDLRAMNTVNADAIRGLDLNANGPVKVNHNTVVLNTSNMSAADFGTSALYVSSDVVAEISNNIFVNLSVPGSSSGYAAAYRRSSSANLQNHLPVSGNNCFYVSAGIRRGVYADNINVDTTIQEFRFRMGPARESLSFSELPPFLSTMSPFNLTMSTTLPTQCESAGRPAGTVADYYGNVRNTATPDVGAEEGTFTAVDRMGPIISYIPAGNTTSFGNITLQAEISDLSGVDLTPGAKPRLYFKKASDPNEFNGNHFSTAGWKYTEPNNITSPFEFTTDYSLLNSSVMLGDTIQYFVAAQDASPNSNVSAYIGFLANADPDMLDSIHFPVSGPVSAYRILPGLSGVQPVGAGASYTNLNSIATELQSVVLTGDVIFELQSNYVSNETFPVVFRGSIAKDDPSYTVTIRPASGVTGVVTQGDPGAANLPLIDLNGVSDIVFDGRPSGALSGIEWIFRNSRTTTPSSVGPVFRFINGAQHNTLRFVQVESGSTSGNGSILFSTTTGNGNSYNLITGSRIRTRSDIASTYAIGIVGAGTAAAPNTFNTISNNHVFNFVSNGINIGSTGNAEGWTISGNHFYHNLSTPPATAQRAILFTPGSGSYNNLISGNYIGGTAPFCGGAPWTNTGNTANFQAISVGCDTIKVEGNTIRNFAWTGTTNNAWTGILVDNTTRYADVLHNTVGDSTLSDTIRVMGTNNTIGISSASPGVVNIHGNGIHMLFANRAATGVSVKGIQNSGNDAVASIAGNSVSNLYTASTKVNYSTTADFAVNGILSSSSGEAVIANNHVRDLSVLSSGTSVVATAGIAISRAASGSTISANRIYDLNMLSTGDSNRVFGIAVFEAPAPVHMFNNMISLAPPASANIYGIGHEGVASASDQAGPLYIRHNTVVLHGSVLTGTASHTYGFYSRFATPAYVQNNILQNERSGGAGSHIAVAQLSPAPAGWVADYNTLWSADMNTAGAWGSPAAITDITSWKANSGADVNTRMQSFTYTDMPGGDLHLIPGWYGSLLLQGMGLPAVPVDVDGDARTTHPYIGADEVASHPLPVKLMQFSAARVKHTTQLKWRTASEQNAGRFEIERSANGKQFSHIGTVKAYGNSPVQRTYSYDDATAPFAEVPVVYYRLKMVDNDGTVAYSEVVALASRQSADAGVTAYPNPFSGQLYVGMEQEQAVVITVSDITGKTVLTRSYGAGHNTIDLSGEAADLHPGVYFLRMEGGSSTVIKLIKQ
jgi:hypothetical protein